MATAFFFFLGSPYKKFLLTLFMSCQSPFAKPYLTLKEAEFDKQLATYS